MIFTIGCIFGKYKEYLGILQDPIEKMSNIDGVDKKNLIYYFIILFH